MNLLPPWAQKIIYRFQGGYYMRELGVLLVGILGGYLLAIYLDWHK